MFLVEFADVWFVSALAVLWLAAISPLVALIVAYLKGLKVARLMPSPSDLVLLGRRLGLLAARRPKSLGTSLFRSGSSLSPPVQSLPSQGTERQPS